MKNFVKALDTKDREFAFLHQKFQQKSMEKIKAGIFDGPQIRELIKDTSFDMHWILLNSLPGCPYVRHCKLPWQPQKFPVSQGGWWVNGEFLSNWCTHVSENAFPPVSSGVFSRELWRLQWRTGWALSQRYQWYGETLSRPMGCQLSGWLLLVSEEGCGVCSAQMEVPEETIHPLVTSLVHYTLLAAFSKYFWAFFNKSV